MTSRWSVGLIAKVNDEIFIDHHAAVFVITIYHQHNASLVTYVRVELIVPGGKKRSCHIEAFAIEALLYHLRAARYIHSINRWCFIEHATIHT